MNSSSFWSHTERTELLRWDLVHPRSSSVFDLSIGRETVPYQPENSENIGPFALNAQVSARMRS